MYCNVHGSISQHQHSAHKHDVGSYLLYSYSLWYEQIYTTDKHFIHGWDWFLVCHVLQ